MILVHNKVEELCSFHTPHLPPLVPENQKGNKSVSHLLEIQRRLTIGSLKLDSRYNFI